MGDKGELYYVDGLPEPDRISSFSGTPFCENGVAYVGVIPITADGETNHPAIYKIDPVTHTATKGLTVNATGITAIGRLAKGFALNLRRIGYRNIGQQYSQLLTGYLDSRKWQCNSRQQ